MNFKKILKWAASNYFVLIVLGCLGFVGLVSFYRMFVVKPSYVYVKVKMGQGLWWATTQRPSMWYVEAIRQAKEEKDLTQMPVVKVQNVTYYPWYNGNQYDIYVIAKLRASKTGSGKYSFKRSTIGVGVPIDFEFNSVQFSGTIIEMSEKPLKDQFIEKTITLTKKGAYPWEYDAIHKGDKISNGETEIFEVLDKQASDTMALAGDAYGNYLPTTSEQKKYIIVKAKIKGTMENGQFTFAEEQPVMIGRTLNLATPNFVFNDYAVASIE